MRCLQRPLTHDAAFLTQEPHEERGNFAGHLQLFHFVNQASVGWGWMTTIRSCHQKLHERRLKNRLPRGGLNFVAMLHRREGKLEVTSLSPGASRCGALN